MDEIEKLEQLLEKAEKNTGDIVDQLRSAIAVVSELRKEQERNNSNIHKLQWAIADARLAPYGLKKENKLLATADFMNLSIVAEHNYHRDVHEPFFLGQLLSVLSAKDEMCWIKDARLSSDRNERIGMIPIDIVLRMRREYKDSPTKREKYRNE